ncbi:MAG: preprotein translocase subunit SecE [Verrucomicrobia bacterium]|nr:preprotein translocase subunit SecE [Verrucomicrobiota bacterium]
MWLAVLAAVFAVLWRKGQIARLAAYTAETREELKKCTWPTVDELKGSTLVVFVSIILLGGFTVFVDYILVQVVRLING